ncbi:MAG: 1-acyl-sn-glycerol-3-phosphate acyltransferase [Acidimicrobiia bacterium]
MLPPRIVRRLFVAPLVALGGLVLIVLFPIVVLIALAYDLLDRHGLRATRLATLVFLITVYEVAGLLALLLLWIVSGFGLAMKTSPMQRAHVGLSRWWLNGVTRSIRGLLGVRISYEQQTRATGPVMVFSRHGGPADSVFLARTLLVEFSRQPRIVAKRELQWAPFMDTVCNRLPNHFVDRKPKDRQHELDAIEQLAASIDDTGALILFPEGGNFTARRRDRAIASLRGKGNKTQAAWATQMPNLIAPRPGGALAAMRGAPAAEVVFVAHSGLEDLQSVRDIWEALPLNRTLKGHYWRTTPEERPTDLDQQVAWLYRWWAQIDLWIEKNRPEDVTPAPPV